MSLEDYFILIPANVAFWLIIDIMTYLIARAVNLFKAITK